MRRTTASLVGLLALAIAPRAFAAATLVAGLGGPVGYGTSCMPPNDDGSWPAGATGLDLTPAFPSGIHFYSGTYTTGWINNNGSLSFQSAISTFTPNAFPGAPQPMIAPYWADVDTRDASECGNINYPSGGGYPANATCMNPATNGVWWSITPGQVVITWDQVGFFLCHTTPVMSFQMILSAAQCGGASGMDFNIEFRYSQCGWEVGDASGGSAGFCPPGTVGVSCTPAQAGFDSAETPVDMDYASLPMSRMAGISTELCTGSNLMPAQPGIWQFLVRNGSIMCPTAGQPCATGMPGICAQGQLQCTATGMTTCVPITMPQASTCNGLDNNCDGIIDTGPCPTGLVCDGTECVPQCEEGGCPAGQTCTSKGLCVETDCVNVVCNSDDGGATGERCVHGVCVDACTGVTCPIGQVCRLGACVDPCAGLNCGMGQVCENGMCVPSCPCTTCSASQTCEMSGHCVATDCATVTCPTGQVCQAGACIDECTGAVCPAGQTCKTGMCIPAPVVDAGSEGGGLVLPGSEDGGNVTDGGMDGAADAGSSFNAGAGARHAGCGCRVTRNTGARGWGIGLGIGLLAVLARRRRRSPPR